MERTTKRMKTDAEAPEYDERQFKTGNLKDFGYSQTLGAIRVDNLDTNDWQDGGGVLGSLLRDIGDAGIFQPNYVCHHPQNDRLGDLDANLNELLDECHQTPRGRDRFVALDGAIDPFIYNSVVERLTINLSTNVYDEKELRKAKINPKKQESSSSRPEDLKTKVRKRKPDATNKTRGDVVLGMSDFSRLYGSKCFIDKSMLIKEVWNNPSTVTLITAPRRSGKSSALSIVKNFFGPLLDANGVQRTDITNSEEYKRFLKLKIGADDSNIMEKFGKYPVIHITASCIESISSEKDAIDRSRNIIYECYLEHEYLSKSQKITKSARESVKKWCDSNKLELISKSKVYRGLRDLSMYLYQHFDNTPCFILIDEYDSITMSAISSGASIDALEKINNVVGSALLSFVKDNDKFVKRALLTGITHVYGVWSWINNVVPYTFLKEHPYNEFYGVTEEELKSLLEGESPEVKRAVKDYYNGYVSANGKSLYNIWSVMNFLSSGELGCYWTATGSIVGLEQAFKSASMREFLYALMSNQSIEIVYQAAVSPGDFTRLQDFLKTPTDKSWPKNLIFSLMLDQGCLCVDRDSVATSSNDIWVKLPNIELKLYLMKIFKQYCSPDTMSYPSIRLACLDAFEHIFPSTSSVLTLKCALTRYLQSLKDLCANRYPNNNFSHGDVAKLVAFSGMTLCTVEFSEKRVIVSPDTWSVIDYCGYKICANGGNFGMLWEFKVDSSAVKAVEQIIEKKYCEVFETDDFMYVTRSLVLGLNFKKIELDNESHDIQLELMYTVVDHEPDQPVSLAIGNFKKITV